MIQCADETCALDAERYVRVPVQHIWVPPRQPVYVRVAFCALHEASGESLRRTCERARDASNEEWHENQARKRQRNQIASDAVLFMEVDEVLTERGRWRR